MTTVIAKLFFIIFTTILFLLSGRGFFKAIHEKNRGLSFLATLTVLILSVFSLYQLTDFVDDKYQTYRFEKLDNAAWYNALIGGSIEDFDSYLRKFPNGNYNLKAQSKISSIKQKELIESEAGAWLIVQELDTRSAYGNYLISFPNGKNLKVAEQRLSELPLGDIINNGEKLEEVKTAHEEALWNTIKDLNTLDGHLIYQKLYPTGLHIKEAVNRATELKKLNELNSEDVIKRLNDTHEDDVWEASNKIRTLGGFLLYKELFPEGKYLDGVSTKIAGLKENINFESEAHKKQIEEKQENAIWRAANELQNLGGFLIYKELFPNGTYIAEAIANISDIREQQSTNSSNRSNLLSNESELPAEPEMVKINTGSFLMGDSTGKGKSNERPVRSSGIWIQNAFMVSKFEITNSQWNACYNAGGCDYSIGVERSEGREDYPVTGVSWADAQQFVQWLRLSTGKAYRLPTETEWEYMARASSTTAYPWGNTAGHFFANYGKDDGTGGLALNHDKWVGESPVGSFPPNKFGVFDANGNAAEWVEDCNLSYESFYHYRDRAQTPYEEQGCKFRLARGGSYLSPPLEITSSAREALSEQIRGAPVGIRVALTLKETDLN